MAERRTTAHLFRVWYNHDSVTDAARLAAAMELLDGGDTAYELAVSFEELVFMRSKFQLAAVDTPAEPTPKQEAAAACRQLRHVRAAYVETLTTAAFAPEGEPLCLRHALSSAAVVRAGGAPPRRARVRHVGGLRRRGGHDQVPGVRAVHDELADERGQFRPLRHRRGQVPAVIGGARVRRAMVLPRTDRVVRCSVVRCGVENIPKFHPCPKRN